MTAHSKPQGQDGSEVLGWHVRPFLNVLTKPVTFKLAELHAATGQALMLLGNVFL